MTVDRDTSELDRCWRFELELGEALAERVEDVGGGITAVLDTRLPLVWDLNYLVAESAEVSAAQLAAKADEVLERESMEHRAAVTRDPRRGSELAPGFEELGWETEWDVYMALRRDPDRPAEVEVERVDLDQIEHVRKALTLGEDWGTPEVAEQLLASDHRVGEVRRDRWFAARHEGRLASACRLIQHEGVGQVEDVITLEAARNQGLARAVILAAAQTSVDDGDELTFIAALAYDWPRHLYQRLGFEAVGTTCSFRRKPS
ncbi:MAG: GNAT family N-acetyltransferase [Actinomycetota bacterium]